MSALLEVKDLRKHYRLGAASLLRKRRVLQAVAGVSFSIAPGEVLALVGESGCGKSTIGRCLLQLEQVDGGEVLFDGERIDTLGARAFRPYRRKIQMVFQDPYGSLDPRMSVEDILAEPLLSLSLCASRQEARARVPALLDMVSMPASAAQKRPHEFSGGQRQRIGIARAMAAEPQLIVCDEAVSALDVSVKAQIVNLLADLRDELGLAMLFISHDLAIVERLADRVAVMYLGRMAEIGPASTVLGQPTHPYTKGLLAAAPRMDEPLEADRLLQGEPPDPANPPSGCRFRTRCPVARSECAEREPDLAAREEGHELACHFPDLVPDLAKAWMC